MSLTDELFGSAEKKSKNDSSNTALSFEPVKKAKVDLFAPAPQYKKASRRDKSKLLAAEKSEDVSPNENTTDNLFKTVLVTDEQKNSTLSSRKDKKSKHKILRHALNKNEEEDSRTVYVGNLPNTIDKRDVAHLFKECGAVESVRVRCQALESADEAQANLGRAIRVLRGHVIKDDDKYSASAYVLYKSRDSVQEALKKNGTTFRNRHIVVTTMDPEGKEYPPETSIFIGNISYDTTEEDVWNFFVNHGISDIKRVHLIRDRETGKCKGFGYAEFYSKKSVSPAIAVRGTPLNGRDIRIVHVQKSKQVAAASMSRREKRSRSESDQSFGRRQSKFGRGEADRSRFEPRKKNQDSDLPSWAGVTTNARKKIPKDLRPLIEGGRDKPKGPRAPVKHKMRNPEK